MMDFETPTGDGVDLTEEEMAAAIKCLDEQPVRTGWSMMTEEEVAAIRGLGKSLKRGQ